MSTSTAKTALRHHVYHPEMKTRAYTTYRLIVLPRILNVLVAELGPESAAVHVSPLVPEDENVKCTTSPIISLDPAWVLSMEEMTYLA